MSAEAEGAVDDHGTRLLEGRGQQVQASLEHHRDVSGLAHAPSQVPARSCTYGLVPTRSKGDGLPAPGKWRRPTGEREEAGPYVRRARGEVRNVRDVSVKQ
ncbi:hypothetical protein GCM10010353_04910 [Streptomyces chryseus]|uniref:Uncharacterized protein n=1 Tax=Streptomyces chryseus TaxID=68186 RepID=A0ABQ3DE76_9ACTN|nr:hypothetical protein GCM10010353_04910 [Streptomyces chryseus]GHA84391.1 hypothetical protein GCM10010346_03620 [Streptomyces chryseus]